MNKKNILLILGVLMLMGASFWVGQIIHLPASMSQLPLTGGKVTSVSGNTITVATPDPLNPGKSTARSFKINSSTKIEKEVALDPTQAAVEQAQFQAALAHPSATSTPPTPPALSQTQNAAVSDIATGSFIALDPPLSHDGETAVTIVIQSMQ